MKDKPADLTLTGYEKFIHVDLDCTFQKLLQAEFWWGIQVHLQLPEKSIIFFSPFELLLCVKLDSPHILQPKQQTATT